MRPLAEKNSCHNHFLVNNNLNIQLQFSCMDRMFLFTKKLVNFRMEKCDIYSMFDTVLSNRYSMSICIERVTIYCLYKNIKWVTTSWTYWKNETSLTPSKIKSSEAYLSDGKDFIVFFCFPYPSIFYNNLFY